MVGRLVEKLLDSLRGSGVQLRILSMLCLLGGTLQVAGYMRGVLFW